MNLKRTQTYSYKNALPKVIYCSRQNSKMTVKILTQPQETEFSQELMSLEWDSKPQMVLLPWKTS